MEQRFYLIRVGMERFLGPFTLKQVQESYHKMQFGLQDEISGSLRPWVSFDNIEGVRRHYPELVQLIHTEMMSGWGMSAMPAAPSAASQRMSLRHEASPGLERAPSNFNILWAFLFLFVLGGAAAFFSYRDGEWVNPVAYLKDRQYYQAKSYLGDKYNPRFEGYMDRNHNDISHLMKKKVNFSKWIPYVRSVAYAKDGRWDGVGAKKLRGTADSYLPPDCSVAYWDERWKESKPDWQALLEGRRLPHEEWSRLLMMDTHWIRNHSPMPGWMDPGSYNEACLRMALKSITKLTEGDLTPEAKVIISRLRWQLSGIAGTSQSDEYEMSGTLWAISCLEDAHAQDDLKNCFNSVRVRGPFQDYFDGMVLIRKMALLAAEDPMGEASLKDLQTFLGLYPSKAAEIFMDYDAELHFYQEVLAQKGNVKAAKASMAKKYPGTHFEP